jgi:hypothetical protein
VYDEEVAPVMFVPFNFHWYERPVPVLAFNTTLPPWQNVVAVAAVIIAVGRAFTVTTVAVLVEEHVLALVTTTV